MNVPEGVIELTVASVVGFVFKVVFGLIAKNEKKSEDEDRRLETEIKELRQEMNDKDEKRTRNEHKLFDKVGVVAESLEYQRGLKDGVNDATNSSSR